MKCPVCKGINSYEWYRDSDNYYNEGCHFCGEMGKVTLRQWLRFHFWDWFWGTWLGQRIVDWEYKTRGHLLYSGIKLVERRIR